MPAVALRIEEQFFLTCIETYTRGLCRRWHVPRVDTDDLVQEVWTEVHASLVSFRPSRGDFVPWTRGIAWKVIRRHQQNARRYAQRFTEYHANIDQHPAPDPSPEGWMQQQQAQAAISIALSGLAPMNVDIFVLHVVDDLGHAEIGQILQISTAKCQKCFQRTRDDLARCLHDKRLAAMPLHLVGCNDPAEKRPHDTRWSERSHYAMQVSTLIAISFFALSARSSVQSPPTLEDENVRDPQSNPAMYDHAKRVGVQDEPSVLPDAPVVKPKSASLRSVRVVSTPAKLGDKPAGTPNQPPVPVFTYTPKFEAHRPGNKR